MSIRSVDTCSAYESGCESSIAKAAPTRRSRDSNYCSHGLSPSTGFMKQGVFCIKHSGKKGDSGGRLRRMEEYRLQGWRKTKIDI